MPISDLFYKAIGLDLNQRSKIQKFSKEIGIPVKKLNYYNEFRILPSGRDLEVICNKLNIDPLLLQLKMGIINRKIEDKIAENANNIYAHVNNPKSKEKKKIFNPEFKTEFGELYKGDCLDLLPNLKSDSVDLVFADPPFNLNKLYPSKINDHLKTDKYLRWSENWIEESIRILKPGGSFFLWNLPKWNSFLSRYLNNRLTFKHWIAVDIKSSLPIQGRLYPSHYSLLFYCKGEKLNVFHPDRLPMDICQNCLSDLVDYGGYKHKMNPKGVNMSDVWKDIPPVRHHKYKGRKNSNELSIKLLDRIIEMVTEEDDIIFDPFGGSGTTYLISEIKKRKWIGIEIGPLEDIIERFKRIELEAEFINDYRSNINCLFNDENKKKRKEHNLWICETVSKDKNTLTKQLQSDLINKS